MPTYEYECQNCGKIFEYFQSINEPPRRSAKSVVVRLKGLSRLVLGSSLKALAFT